MLNLENSMSQLGNIAKRAQQFNLVGEKKKEWRKKGEKKKGKKKEKGGKVERRGWKRGLKIEKIKR